MVVAFPLTDIDQTLHHLLFVELLVAAAVLFAIALDVVVGRAPRATTRCRRWASTAGAIAAGDLSRRVEPADEHSEVGRLGLALNSMLGQIEVAFAERTASEARLRRFVADAGHELRTPLTSIRGYAELFRRGANTRPDDLAKTMIRIEEAAARMGVLVEDLLLLARLDQGRPLEREQVDLSRLAGAAVDDVRAISPERTVTFTSTGPVIVTGDEYRLRQVVANLLENARTHTPADARRSRCESAWSTTYALIEIQDHGPGMTSEEAAHAFERFWRADPSRARSSGGAGLGLSIVAAITQAHGGRAEVQTAPGAGATFRIWLPRSGPAANAQAPGAERPAGARPPLRAPPRGPARARTRLPTGASVAHKSCGLETHRLVRGRRRHDELAEVVAPEEADERLGCPVEAFEHVLARAQLALGEPLGRAARRPPRSGPNGRAC